MRSFTVFLDYGSAIKNAMQNQSASHCNARHLSQIFKLSPHGADPSLKKCVEEAGSVKIFLVFIPVQTGFL